MSWRICMAALLPIFCLAFSLPSQAEDKIPAAIPAKGVAGDKIKFKKTVLDTTFRSEGVAVGDFNKDGKKDIAAGYVIYEAPDWKMRELTKDKQEYNGASGYSHSFGTFANDVNGDGLLDLLVVDFPGTPTWVLENSGKPSELWKKYAACPVTNNESPQFRDIDGDGKPELIIGVAPDGKADGPDRQMAIVHVEKSGPFKIQAIGAPGGGKGVDRYSHGLGIGDLNKDGLNDILVREGWYEGKKGEGEWKFHPAPFGEACSDMHVYDFDGDGDQDVLSCAAHGLGMWWHEQLPEGRWKTNEISKDFSQTHAVCFADINGDGLPDFITGKRFWAHGPKGDVNPDAPAKLAWFELQRKDGKPIWTEHLIDDNSGVGTQFEVADVNGDGLLDIAISNKKGVFLFEQQR